MVDPSGGSDDTVPSKETSHQGPPAQSSPSSIDSPNPMFTSGGPSLMGGSSADPCHGNTECQSKSKNQHHDQPSAQPSRRSNWERLQRAIQQGDDSSSISSSSSSSNSSSSSGSSSDSSLSPAIGKESIKKRVVAAKQGHGDADNLKGVTIVAGDTRCARSEPNANTRPGPVTTETSATVGVAALGTEIGGDDMNKGELCCSRFWIYCTPH